MNILLTPPIAFLIYVPLVFLIYMLGKVLASPESPSAAKSSLYSSGELAPKNMAAPGYRPFMVIAFFFAVLHLSILVIASGGLTPRLIPYLIGVLIALVALILG